MYFTLEHIAAYPEAWIVLQIYDLDYGYFFFRATVIISLQGPVMIHLCFLYNSMAQWWSVRNLLHYAAYGGCSRARQYNCCALEVSGSNRGIDAEGRIAGVQGVE